MIDIDSPDGIQRHAGGQCRRRILNHGNPALTLDFRQTCDSIVEAARKNHPCYPRTIGRGRGTEQRIDGRPRVVLLRTMHNPQTAWRYLQMKVGRGAVYLTMLDLFAVDCLFGRKFSRPAKDLGKYAPAV